MHEHNSPKHYTNEGLELVSNEQTHPSPHTGTAETFGWINENTGIQEDGKLNYIFF